MQVYICFLSMNLFEYHLGVHALFFVISEHSTLSIFVPYVWTLLSDCATVLHFSCVSVPIAHLQILFAVSNKFL